MVSPDNLNLDVLELIFSFLSGNDLPSVASVSSSTKKSWNQHLPFLKFGQSSSCWLSKNRPHYCPSDAPLLTATVSQLKTPSNSSLLSFYLLFKWVALQRWYTVAFALVPFHLFVMVAGLLCSNHVTYRFGKGMMPKAYRLSMTSMAIIMDNYAR